MTKKLIFILWLFFIFAQAYAQLEVKQGSFKEVPGFVNVNPDPNYQTDDNDLPFAVLKIRTENINDKQRHELKFSGNAGTFIMLEYKDGEVWVYLTAQYASYIKISHPDFSSIEYTFPFDMQPKCGYELTLVNKAEAVVNGWASLTITTKPENGADITLNGREVDQLTPYTNDMIPTGKYDIVVSKEGFKVTTQSIELQEGDKQVVVIDMPYDYGQEFDKIEQTYTVNGVTFTMIPVQGGTFTMGCTSARNSCIDNELPSHKVTLNSFLIGKFEVTQELWKAVMGSYSGGGKKVGNPVDNVNWNNANLFIEKLNQLTGKKFRLPTEAEWEFAARGGNKSRGYKYSGSDNADDVAWYDGNSKGKVQPVGKKMPNELGIYDMSGNVWEWCQDYYGDYQAERQFNPTGSPKGSSRVIRGGSFEKGSWYCRTRDRSSKRPDIIPPIKSGGFRLVLVP